MGEGVDPTQMCQTLVHKVARSRQLMAITDPDILGLFENWLDELEEEVMLFINEHPNLDATELAENLGLSKSGASFLITKLQREEKI
jgi:DNA-binding MarR family transcriptional regulator